MSISQTITDKIIVTLLLLLSVSQTFAQYTYPDESEMLLLGRSENLTSCKLFRNDLCNVFLFTPKNVICSVGGNVDSTPYVIHVSKAGECKTAFLAGNKFIVQHNNEIVSLSQDRSSISQSTQEEKLYTYGKRAIKAFSSNRDGFFIVEYRSDKRTKETTSTLSYFNLNNRKLYPVLETHGKINCVSGDPEAICLGLDTNLVLVANGQSAIITVENEDITAVAPSSVGIFYGTRSSVNFINDDFEIIGIAKQGALQLIDNCNTLYMILTDGSLIRIHNTLAFAEFYNLSKQLNNEKDESNH